MPGCAYLNDEEPYLTPIEYKLLYLLSKKVGKVLTDTFSPKNYLGDGDWKTTWPPCGPS